MHRARQNVRIPEVGEILQGRIVRIEQYGAFCGLEGLGRLQGLIHISQLVEEKVEKVEDVVSVDDIVWVKVMQVEMDSNSQRWRIRLSMKDVSQDGERVDLGRERENKEQQRNQLETNLNSMIGMGVARDPMADRLILKHEASKKTTFRGGYSLVDDDEGEPDLPSEPVNPEKAQVLPPVGRGRGATLPAWMTSKSDGLGTGDSASSNGEDDSRSRKKKKKKKHKKDSKKSRKYERERSDRREKKKKRHRRNDYSDSEDSGSFSSSSRHDRKRRKKEKSRRSDNDQYHRRRSRHEKIES